MNAFPTGLLILICIGAFLPIFAATAFAIRDALRISSPDPLRFRERLACGIANAKLAVAQKVAAGWRLVKLLGAAMYLAPHVVVVGSATLIGYLTAWAFKGIVVGVREGYDLGVQHLKATNSAAVDVLKE